MTSRNQQAGFTLIELILAMALFSFVLLLITAGFINIVRIHEAGLASRNTQRNGRFILEEIIRNSRSAYDVSTDSSISSGNFTGLCLTESVSSRRFYVNASNELVSDALACGQAPVAAQTQKLSSNDVEAAYLRVIITTKKPKSATIFLGMTTKSAGTVLTADGSQCDVALGANQFCSVTGLQSTVSLRGQNPL